MAGSGDIRFILKSSEGYIRQDGTYTPDPNEAFHGNVYNAGGRFASFNKVIESLVKATQYTGEINDLTFATFTNWKSLRAKETHDIFGSNELGYSDPTFLQITEEDLHYRN